MTDIGKQFQQLQMFATPHEIANMRSSDHTMKKMTEIEPDMERMHEHARIPRADPQGNVSPDFHSYLDSMQKHVEKVGGIEIPAIISNYHSGTEGQPAQAVDNGHHRALIAMRTNRLLPVLHIAPEGDFRVREKGQREGWELEYQHEAKYRA